MWSKRGHCVEQEGALCGAREGTVWSKRGHCVEQERALCRAWNRTFPVVEKKTMLIASRLFNGRFKNEAQTALFKDPVRTAQKTLFISVIKTNQFML